MFSSGVSSMRLDCFLLADAAAAEGGKLYIHGGGITRLNVASVPLILPQLAVVIRWVAEPEDLLDDHLVEFSLSDPGGGAVIPRTRLPMAIGKGRDLEVADGEERIVQLALGFAGVPFRKFGVYSLMVSLDSVVVRAMTLPVVEVPDPALGS